MKKMTVFTATALLCAWLFSFGTCSAQELIPVGQVVGLELQNGTVTVAALEDRLAVAPSSGLEPGDVLVKIDGQDIRCGEDVRRALKRSDGCVLLEVLRKGKPMTLELTPQITGEGPKLGIYLRQGVNGIGTVTWYDPQTGKFGTLGHGVNDAQGKLLTLERGKAYDAQILTVKKGRSGTPGQLMGAIDGSDPVGELTANTEQGVFGKTRTGWKGRLLPSAEKGEIHTGKATILATVSGDETQEYSVEILKIYPKSRQTGRNMLLRVTDDRLLEATGGIVQGMSGSPIIQNGKLVGAVTHVLVNDPTTGYGIFIDNMLDAAA